jgi:putative redox protein
VAPKPAVIVDLAWEGDLRFSVSTPRSAAGDIPAPPLVLDSAGAAGPSPVTALAAALAGCMAMDVAHILHRGRHTVRDIKAHLEAERSTDEPHRLVGVRLRFDVLGDVPSAVVERAIALSHDKYCSVWHSMRQDIDFQVTFALGA